MMMDKSLLNIHYLKYLDAVWTDLVTYLPAGQDLDTIKHWSATAANFVASLEF